MSTRALLISLLRYKASVDRELLSALASVSEDRDRLQSALRVLDHAHRVDRIFAANLQKQEHAFKTNWATEAPTLQELTVAIMETDQWYLDYVSTIDPEDLEEVVTFTFTDGQQGRMSRAEMLAHVVTHAGYHRGETGALLPEIESTAMRDVFAAYLHRSEPQRRR